MATHPHHHGDVHLDEADWAEFAAHTELEGELLIGFVTATMERVKDLRGPDAPPIRRVLDIGCGPAVGSCELARLFPAAHVVALDGSPAMLSRASRRADELGLGGRIRTHLAELPAGLDGLEPVDLIWASMSLHHVGDGVSLLRSLHDLLTPAGLIAIAEIAEPMRVLPDQLDVGPLGLAQRLDHAGAKWFAALRRGLADGVQSTDISTCSPRPASMSSSPVSHKSGSTLRFRSGREKRSSVTCAARRGSSRTCSTPTTSGLSRS